MRIKPIPPKKGQESVWDYPRPPLLEATSKRLEVIFNGKKIADTTQGYRVLETSHPPGYYLPPSDIKTSFLIPSPHHTYCEWKGEGFYFHLQVNGKKIENAAWYYTDPTAAFASIKNYVAFYPAKMDECRVNGELVIPQPGNFYGGWITQDIVGPFKGEPGTWGW